MVKVSNIHTRTLPISIEVAGQLIDSLASHNDKLWPKETWPPMRFDRPLALNAIGGHGPIKYFVNDYKPGRFLSFKFIAPKGFEGTHSYKLESSSLTICKLTHSLVMDTTGVATLTWLLAIRPLHDALIEDSLALAEQFALVPNPSKKDWSLWVKFLRLLLKRSSKRQSN
jgi:hypothetical protein